MRNWLKTHRKQVLQLLLAFGVGLLVSGAAFLAFWLTGVIYYDGGFRFDAGVLDALRGSPWIYVAFVGLEAVCCLILCMNPIGSGVFTWLGIALFGANWKCFLACFCGCFLSYVMIDALGRFGGSKLITRIFGEGEFAKVREMINTKGILYALFVYLFPIFPDDFCCLVFGSMRMNWGAHMAFAAIGKSAGIATVVFGVSLIPKELFLPLTADKLYNWFVLGGVLIAYVAALMKGFRWANKRIGAALERRLKAKRGEKPADAREDVAESEPKE